MKKLAILTRNIVPESNSKVKSSDKIDPQESYLGMFFIAKEKTWVSSTNLIKKGLFTCLS